MTAQLAEFITVRCAICRRPSGSHPVVNPDHRRRVLAMRAGALTCDHCGALADPASLREHGLRWADAASGTVYGPRYAPSH